jgi:GT2 family glycosyltransferase
MFKVAVQLLSWNGEKHLRACLDSLAKQKSVDFELLVLDNASTDASIAIIEDVLKNFPHPSRFIKEEKNLGFSGGHNKLFAMSQAPYVCCVNQDVVVAADYLERIVSFLERNAGVGSVAGLLSHEDGSVDTAGLVKNWYEKIYDIIKAPVEKELRVFGVSGALPVYRRAAVIEVSPDGKLFDENFFSYKEDADLAWRLNAFGWSSFVISEAKALHERGFGADKKWNAAQYSRQKLSSRNHLLTLVKDLPAADLWRVPVLFFYELGKMAYLAVFVPKALGYISDFFRLLPETIKVRKVVAERLKAKKNNG